MSEKPASQKRQIKGSRSGLGPGDHSRSYSPEKPGYQTVGGSRALSEKQSERVRATVGVVLAIVTLMGAIACLWFGWRINYDLGRLTDLRRENTREKEVNLELTTRRDSLLTKTTITRKGAVLGLFPPTKKQIRKP